MYQDMDIGKASMEPNHIKYERAGMLVFAYMMSLTVMVCQRHRLNATVYIYFCPHLNYFHGFIQQQNRLHSILKASIRPMTMASKGDHIGSIRDRKCEDYGYVKWEYWSIM